MIWSNLATGLRSGTQARRHAQRARVLARLQFTFQESVRIPIQRMYMNQSIVPKQRKPRNSNRIPVLIIIREDAPPGIESECIWKLD